MPASLSPSSSATCVVSATRWLLVVDSAAIRFCAADNPGVARAALERRDLPGCRLGEAGPGGGREELPDAQPSPLGNTATQLGVLERVEPTVPVTWERAEVSTRTRPPPCWG